MIKTTKILMIAAISVFTLAAFAGGKKCCKKQDGDKKCEEKKDAGAEKEKAADKTVK